ncbi:long-chain fatty acid--CoA ligase [Alicyclobacillus sp. ALC3]|uniref:long-chain fatty acid--CoA ligase n=1 Tax=Alicyclobacillus sp. ALC3 TaxID=2796143 RepID=UPI0023788C7C|nr:long-chain fatty acid--CoA ligase [Alicyclobacillus sp. ALC3]WDL95727.1 long-chain fatty acid--CoA ligase [Alicyclobacillus sp. ALC3]
MFTRHFAVWPEATPKSLTVPKTTLYDNLLISAKRYPDKTVVNYYGNRLTFGQLLLQVNAIAGYLQRESGVKKGDRVLLYMQNSPQFFIAYYGILAVGGVVVPMNPMNMTDELRFYIEDCGTRVAVVGQELLDRIEPLLAEPVLDQILVTAYGEYVFADGPYNLPDVVKAERRDSDRPGLRAWADALALGRSFEDVGATCDDVAVLPYTSGTTGKPKGCIHTHRTVMANVVGSAMGRGANSESVALCVLPLFHVTGMIHSMHLPLYIGSTAVLMTRWDRETAAQLIEDNRCTVWTNIATMLIDFLANPNLPNYDISSLQSVGGGGATLPEAVGQRLFQFTGVRYTEGYGLSETIAQTHFNPPDHPKLQCMGIPSFDVDARVVNPDNLDEVGVGEDGELLVRGPQVFHGYWNRPEEDEKAFVELDGQRFFRTGDLVRYDDEGYFFHIDRLKRMINASGFKVWPTEVESMLYDHEAVQMACVIGVPDERRGETVKAFIVLRADWKGRVTEDEIMEWTHDRMAAYKRPRIVEFVDSLPMTATGKVQWRELQERAWAATKA